MSKEIDEKVVSMVFENKSFESNVNTSINTIAKLKQSLQFKDSNQGIQSIGESLKKLDFSPIGNGIDAVKSKFSALEIAGITAVTRLTNEAITAGKKIAAAFTTDPIKTGFQEYETQINAIQTIYSNTSSKGTTLDQINSALDELNHYADMTIYNFTEMTRNIGTFTAAGVDLDTSVSAIKGIANLAASSGSTSTQASTAMYQLSQALAAGTVKLQDWNSVVNAGMGGQLFQDALKETARVHGIAIDQMIEDEGSFRETLSKGWLTSDILTETLNKFTGDMTEAQLKQIGYTDEQIEAIIEMGEEANDAATKVKTVTQLFDTLKEAAQSGWTSSWQNIIGDYGEAKEFLTKVSDTLSEIINNSANSRNELLAGALNSNWKKLTNQINKAGVDTATFESSVRTLLKDNGYDVKQLVEDYGSLSNAFRDGGASADILRTALDQIKESATSIDLEGVTSGLQFGDTGDEIKKVQEALKSLNYDIGATDVDGIIGKNTEAAIKAFQAANELEETGIVDDDTLAKLQEATESVAELGDEAYSLVDQITVLGGRELLIKSLENAFNALMAVLTPIKEAFREIFPAMTVEQLYDITAGIEAFSEKLMPTEETISNIKATFKGFFAVLDIGRMFLVEVANGIKTLLGNFTGLGGGILSQTAQLGNWLLELRDCIKESGVFASAIGEMTEVMSVLIEVAKKCVDGLLSVKDSFVEFVEGIKQSDVWSKRLAKISEYLSPIIEKIKELREAIKEQIAAPGFNAFLALLNALWTILSTIAEKVAKVISTIGSSIIGAFRAGDFSEMIDILNGGLITGLLLNINKFVAGSKDIPTTLSSMADSAKKLIPDFSGLIDSVKKAFDGVRESLEEWQKTLRANTLLKIAAAVGILAFSMLLVSSIDPERLASALGAITVLFGEVVGAMALLTKLDIGKSGKLGLFSKDSSKEIKMMIGLAVSLLILAYTLKQLADIKPEDMEKGLLGILALMSMMVAAMKILSMGKTKSTKSASQMIALAISMKIMASAVADLSQYSWEELAKAVSAIGAILLEFVGFQALLKLIKPKQMMKSATALVIIGAAMEIFANVSSKFGGMDWESLGKAGAAMTAILAISGGFMKLAGMSKHVMKSAIALVIIGAAMEIFANVCSKLGSMEVDNLDKAETAMFSILAMSSGFMLLAGMSKHVTKSAVALVLIGAAMEIFADVCNKFGSMEWDSLDKAGTAITVILALASGFALLAGVAKGNMLTSAAALVVMAAALNMLVPVFQALGSMSIGAIIKSLISMAAAFAVIGLAATVLTPVIPSILALSGAIALLGIACAAIGAGVMLFAAGLAILGGSAAAGATALVAAVAIIVDGVLSVLINIVSRIGELISAICNVIIECAPDIANAIVTLISSILVVLTESIPEIANSLLQILLGLLTALDTYIPDIVSTIIDLIIKVINALAEKLPELIEAVANLFKSLFSGVLAVLQNVDLDTLVEALEGVGIIGGIMLILSGLAALTPGALVGVAGITAVVTEMAAALAIFGGLAQIPGVEWLVSEGGNFLQIVGTAIGQFVGGIVGGFAEGATSTLPTVGTNLSDFMTKLEPFIAGAKQIDSTTLDGVKSLVEVILALTGSNILESIASFITGESSISKFGGELADFGDAIATFSDKVADIDAEKVEAAANAGRMLAQMEKTIPNSGGLLGKIFGENDLDTFSTQVESFGTAIVNFSTAITSNGGINDEALAATNTACSILSSIATASKKIPNSGGLLGKILGDNDLDTFSTQIEGFGTAMANFSTNIMSGGGISDEVSQAASTACSILVSIAEAADSIPNSGGLLGKIFGENDLDTFSSQIEGFGTSMANFSENITKSGGISDVAVTSTETITNLIKALPQDTEVSIGSFGTELESFGASMTKFMGSMSGFSSKDIAEVSLTISQVFTLFQRYADSSETIAQFNETLTSIANTGIDGFLSAFSDATSQFSEAGAEMVNSVSESATAGLDDLITSFNTTLDNCVKAIRENYDSFRTAGEYLVKGFANGITSKTYLAEAQSRAMANAASLAATRALDEHSPSKVFYKIGAFAGQGFVNALGDYGENAYDAGHDMANYATSGLKKSLATIGSIIDGDIETNPTIRPVLDLSNVVSGVNKLDGMLDTTPAINARLSSIGASINHRQNGSTNDDVISAIRDLGTTMSNSGSTTYNVNGITYDDGSNISDAVRSLIRAARVERRV